MNKERIWDLPHVKVFRRREHKLEIGFDLSIRQGRSCHIITMIPHILHSASVDMDLTRLNMAVKQGPSTAVR